MIGAAGGAAGRSVDYVSAFVEGLVFNPFAIGRSAVEPATPRTPRLPCDQFFSFSCCSYAVHNLDNAACDYYIFNIFCELWLMYLAELLQGIYTDYFE